MIGHTVRSAARALPAAARASRADAATTHCHRPRLPIVAIPAPILTREKLDLPCRRVNTCATLEHGGLFARPSRHRHRPVTHAARAPPYPRTAMRTRNRAVDSIVALLVEELR